MLLLATIITGYNPNNDNATNILTADISDGGIFSFDNVDKENIGKVNFRGHDKLQSKMLEMVSYLVEVGYDIAISPRDNVSSSPKFEPLLGAVV